MPAETHSPIASFIWSICNLLRGHYKRNENRKVILPLTVLRRFDCISEQAAISAYLDALMGKSEAAVERLQEYRAAPPPITAAFTGKIDVRNKTWP